MCRFEKQARDRNQSGDEAHDIVSIKPDLPSQALLNRSFLQKIPLGLRYIVSSGVRSYGRSSRLVGFSVSALSKTMGPDDICERIDAFLPQFRQTLVDMPQEVGGAEQNP